VSVNPILNLPHPLGHPTSSFPVSLSAPMVLCTSGISTWFDCPYTPQYALCMRSICQYSSSSSSSKLAYTGLQAIAMYSIYLQNFFTKYLLYIFISSVYILCSLCSMCNSATAWYVSCISDVICMT